MGNIYRNMDKEIPPAGQKIVKLFFVIIFRTISADMLHLSAATHLIDRMSLQADLCNMSAERGR